MNNILLKPAISFIFLLIFSPPLASKLLASRGKSHPLYDTAQNRTRTQNDVGGARHGTESPAISDLQNELLIAEKKGNDQATYMTALTIANALNEKNQRQDAARLVDRIVAGYKVPDNITDRLNIYSKLLDFYTGENELTKAKHYCELLLLLVNDAKINEGLKVKPFHIIINYFIITKQYAAAKKYLESTLPMNIRAGTIQDRRILFESYFKVDTATRDYKSAVVHLTNVKLMYDSIARTNVLQKVRNVQMQFETEKKERDIQLLRTSNKLQLNALEKSNMTRNVTLLGVLLLLIIVGLLYNRYRLKQEANLEISKKNLSLEYLLSEKEWLLKEIHHRVKNNLQIVISLLNTQSLYLDNDKALEAIRESQHRMFSISLIHQKLYQTENLTCIDMFDYITDLTGYLRECFDTAKNILIMLEVEPICLDVAQAVPIGLILNEAVTNAIKHAFTPKIKGTIVIGLNGIDNENIKLSIADNGKGLPHDFNIADCNSLGMSLMSGLSKQLGGQLKLSNEEGLYMQVIFSKKILISEDNDRFDKSALIKEIPC